MVRDRDVAPQALCRPTEWRCALMRRVPGKSGPTLPLCLTLIIAGVHMALLEKTMACLPRQQGYPMTNALRDVCRLPWPYCSRHGSGERLPAGAAKVFLRATPKKIRVEIKTLRSRCSTGVRTVHSLHGPQVHRELLKDHRLS